MTVGLRGGKLALQRSELERKGLGRDEEEFEMRKVLEMVSALIPFNAAFSLSMTNRSFD